MIGAVLLVVVDVILLVVVGAVLLIVVDVLLLDVVGAMLSVVAGVVLSVVVGVVLLVVVGVVGVSYGERMSEYARVPGDRHQTKHFHLTTKLVCDVGKRHKPREETACYGT